MTRARRSMIGGLMLLLGCSGGGTEPANDLVLAKASPSGDGQTGPAGSTLAIPLRVILTKAGAPLASRTVTWSIAGGSANPASSTTGADGIASTTVTLPPFAASNTVTAVSTGASGSPVRFNVVSTGATAEVTIQVVNDDFLPNNPQLTAGGTVTFQWQTGSRDHNVTPVAPNTIPVSVNPGPPATHNAPYSFETIFQTVGTYVYFCGVHGTPTSGMRGTITVVP